MCRARPAPAVFLPRSPHPQSIEYQSATESECHPAGEAAEQEGLPHGAKPMLQPVPAELEFERTGLLPEQPSTDDVGDVVDGHHGQRVDQEYGRDDRGHVHPGGDGHQQGHRNVDGQGNEADRQARAESARDAASLQRPEARVRERSSERSRIPAILQTLRVSTQRANEIAKHHEAALRANRRGPAA